MKKNKFLTFFCGLIPGAGQMYLGLMRRGLLLMTIFAAIIGASALFRVPPLLFALPVVWFYCFFDTINLGQRTDGMTPEEREALDRSFFRRKNNEKGGVSEFFAKRHLIIGIVCIVAGLWMFIIYGLEPIASRYYETLYWVYSITGSLPTFLISFAIIVLGVYLVRGKKPPQEKGDDLITFKGDRHE